MKRIVAVCLIALAFALVAAAQDIPRFEVYTGFVYTRFNSATNVPAFSANGGTGQFGVNFNHWLGFYADVGSVHNGNISSIHIDTTGTNFLFGPRVTLHHSRLIPYFQILWGGMHASNSIAVSAIPVPPTAGNPIELPGQPVVPAGTPVTLRAVASQTAFAMTVGGGLDIKINKYVSFRPVQLEYLLTRLQNYRSANDNNQSSLRYSTGVNFTFGAQ